jgi:methylthioribulose-1-phosphate dehydratase
MDQRGWVPATAGNISVRIAGGRIAITRSGGHKGFLDSFSVIEVDLDGAAVRPGDRPSAETLLHCQIYRAFADAGAVLHGHSVANTVLSMETDADALSFSGYEVQKIFAGQTTHAATLSMPVVDNDQDMARLAESVAPHLAHAGMGYLIRGHGIYMWGPDMETALARLEGAEFLLACALERRKR